MKKAFGTTHEATENHSEFDIIQFKKVLLFHQKQIEVENLIFSDCPERINDTIYHFPPLGNLDKAHHILQWNFKLKALKLCNPNQK